MNEVSVADFIKNEIDHSSLSQKELAKLVGFKTPNLITMIKLGDSKLPIVRIPKLAKALNIDPALLLEKTYTEYDPDTYSAIVDILGKPVTAVERDVLRIVNSFLSFDAVESNVERGIYIKRLETVLISVKNIVQACNHGSASHAGEGSSC